jgi:hypothetical protein
MRHVVFVTKAVIVTASVAGQGNISGCQRCSIQVMFKTAWLTRWNTNGPGLYQKAAAGAVC